MFEELQNPLCGCLNQTLQYVCCNFVNSTCTEYPAFSNISECTITGGQFFEAPGCWACPYLENASTVGACCYQDSGVPRCDLQPDEASCTLAHVGDTFFNPGQLCNSRDLDGRCDHCGSRGCRSCPMPLNVINALVDLFFVTVNTGLDVSAIKKYPARFIDSMSYNKV